MKCMSYGWMCSNGPVFEELGDCDEGLDLRSFRTFWAKLRANSKDYS